MVRYTIILSCLLVSFSAVAQRISYSDIDKDDYRQMNFEVIGKVGGNINVYKNYKNNSDISVYDNGMKLKDKVRMQFLPDRVSNVDFIAYPDHYHMVYQYQKKNIVHFAVVKLNGDAKMLADPVILDTSHIETSNEIKVYSMIHSENKQRILVYKINRRNDRLYTLTTMLFDKDLQLIKRSVISTAHNSRDGVFNDFVVDNDGDLAFGRSTQSGNREYITNFHLFVKKAMEDSLMITEIPMKDISLDEVKLKPDNFNKRFILTSFYYGQRRGNIDGLLSLIWDKQTNTKSF